MQVAHYTAGVFTVHEFFYQQAISVRFYRQKINHSEYIIPDSRQLCFYAIDSFFNMHGFYCTSFRLFIYGIRLDLGICKVAGAFNCGGVFLGLLSFTFKLGRYSSALEYLPRYILSTSLSVILFQSLYNTALYFRCIMHFTTYHNT